MNLYSVKLIWRYDNPRTKKSKQYHTQTCALLSENAGRAAARGAATLSRSGNVDNIRALVTPGGYGPIYGETVRRCKHNRWDGHQPGDFIPIEIRDDGRVQCGREVVE